MRRVVLIFSLVLVTFAYGVYFVSGSKKRSDISLSPVSAFRDYCTRCHGEEGGAYGKNFGNLSDDSLRMVVEDMMFGPAGLNPDKIEIEAMVAYNKSLKKDKPFAAVMNLKSFLEGKDKNLMIDASPVSDLKTDNTKVGIRKNKEIWELSFDPAKIRKVKITVTRRGSSAFLNYPDELWTK
jgi:hypothetical protein